MPADPLDTVVLACESSISRQVVRISHDEEHPWMLRVSQVADAVGQAQVAFVHVSVPDFPSTIQRLTDLGCVVIALVDRGDVRAGVAAMQSGAVDCVEWDPKRASDLPNRAWRAWTRHESDHARMASDRVSVRMTEDELVKRNRHLSDLNDYANRLAALPNSEDIFVPAVREIKRITSAVGVAMSTYNPEPSELVVRHVSLSREDGSKVMRLLGGRLEGMRMKLTPEQHDRIVQERVKQLGSLSDSTFGTIAPSLSSLIEKAVGVKWFRAISFQDEGKLLGTMVLAGGEGSARPSADELESYAAVTTNALKRWLAERAALGAESRYRLVSEAVHDVIFQSTPDVTFTYLTPSASRLLGYPIEQLLNRNLLELVTPPSAKIVRDRLDKVREWTQTGRAPMTTPFELEMVRADGSTVWVEIVTTPTLSAHGELLGWTGVTRDTTERRQARQALRQSEELLRAFMEQSAEGLAIIDETGTITEWNAGLESITSIRRSDAVGQPAIDVLTSHGNDDEGNVRSGLPRLARELLTGAMDMHTAPSECTWQVRPGQKRVVRCALFPIVVRSRKCVGIAMHDITAVRAAEHKRLEIEKALHQTAKMEAMNRLAGGIAHEFNNLMTAVSGSLELAIQQLREGAVPERQLLDDALSSTQTAETVTRQLLAFSQRQVMQSAPVEADALIRRLEAMLGRLVDDNIELRMDLAAGDRRILGDTVQFEQIVLNLVLNAAEAMPSGGLLTVSTHPFVAGDGYMATCAQPGAQSKRVRPGKYLALEVVDTGRGMSDEVQKHLFEPFFTTKLGGHGSGLGLAAMLGVVEQAGGFVEVRSQVGTGTQIRACWPLLEERTALTSKSSGLHARLPVGTETVMVVDDERAIRSVATRVLKRAGYDVLVASSGEEAVELGRAHPGPIHLLLTDVVMPGMTGKTLSERWRKLHPESALLLTSGYTDDGDVQKGVAAGKFAFLSKPYTVDALAQRVRATLDDHQERQVS